MAKELTVDTAAKIADRYGTEPQIVVAINWTLNVWTEYKDKLLDIGELDDIINVDGDSSSIELAVKLTDLDGSLKTIFNTVDVHKRPVKIYQVYPDVADRILLMTGEVSTPIVWSEGDRTLSLSILTKLEEKEIGFSPEESKLNIAPELATQTWPLAFGKVVNIPAVKVKQVVRGSLRQAIGIPDPSLNAKYFALTQQATILQAQVSYLLSAQVLSSTMAEPAQTILNNYLQNIVDQYTSLNEMFQLQRNLVTAQQNMAQWNKPDKRNPFIQQIQFIKEFMIIQMGVLDEIAITRRQLDSQVQANGAKTQAVQDILSKLATVFDEQRRVASDIAKILNQMADQETYNVGSFGVNGGAKFPQNTPIDIVIKGVRINGSFSGNTFNVGTTALATYTSVSLANRQNDDPDKMWLQNGTLQLKGMYALVQTNRGSTKRIIKIADQVGTQISFDLKDYVAPPDLALPDAPQMPELDTLSPQVIAYLEANGIYSIDNGVEQKLIELQKAAQAEGNYTIELSLALTNIAAFLTPQYDITGQEITSILQVAGTSLPSWYQGMTDSEIANQETSQFWFADGGSEVRLANDNNQVFIANVLESDVIVVQAKKNGRLTPLPDRYYLVENANLNTIHPCVVTTVMPLNEIQGEGWEDQIYVSLESSVGPNVVDIIEWAIETYTENSFDSVSFNHVKAKIAKKHANFVTFDRKQVIQFIKEIAMQACCSIYNKEGVYYLKYLAEEQDAVETITEADVLTQTLNVSLTPTEDIVTKVNATWKSDYYISEPNRMILRHNIKKYGVMEREIDFYIFSDEENVQRSATFWMIRWCNTWKKISCQVSMRKLKVDALDTVLLDFTNNYVADGPIKALVEKSAYQSTDYQIQLELWVPVRAGEMTQYNFAWPANLDISVTFPSIDDIENAGSGGPGADASGTIGTIGDLTGGGRPNDFGTANLGDAGQPNPNDPLAGFGQFGNGNFQNLSPFQLRVLQTINALITGQYALLPQNREVMMGVILEQDGPDVNSFTISLQDGSKLSGVQQYKFDKLENVAIGSAVYVVRGNDPVTFYMQAPAFKPVIKEVEVITEKDDWLECETVDGIPIVVAKPFELRRTSYDNKELGQLYFKYVSRFTRRVFYNEQEFTDNKPALWEENMYPVYTQRKTNNNTGDVEEKGSTLYVGYIEESGIPGQVDNNLKWIDLNSDGRSFRPDACDFIVVKPFKMKGFTDTSKIRGDEEFDAVDGSEIDWEIDDITDPDEIAEKVYAWGPPGSPIPTTLPKFLHNPKGAWVYKPTSGESKILVNEWVVLRRVIDNESGRAEPMWYLDVEAPSFHVVELEQTLSFESQASALILDDNFNPLPNQTLIAKDGYLSSGDSLPSGTRLGVIRRGDVWWTTTARCGV